MANVDQVARALNVTPRRVQQLVKEGMPRDGRGEYDIGPCMAWYIRYLQSALERRGTETGDGIISLAAERARLAKAQADKTEMENAVRRGLLVDLAATESAWGQCISNARAKLLGLGAKLGPRLVNIAEPRQIADAVRTECYAALRELSQYSPHTGANSDGEGEPPVGTAAEPDRQPVGRRRKKAVERK